MSCAAAPEGDGDAEQTMMIRKTRPARGMCVKCKTQKGTILKLSIAYCKECFVLATYARLAKPLHQPLYVSGPQKSVGRPETQPGDVVLALSGGAGSSMLLDLLVKKQYFGMAGGHRPVEEAHEPGKRTGKVSKPFDPVWNVCWVVYIDFSAVVPGAPDLTERVRKQVEAYAEYEIRFVALKAEDAFDSKLVERLEGIARDAKVGENDAAPTTSPSPRDELLRAMSDLPPASYPHMLSQIRDSLLATAALHLPNVSCLLSAETSTRQAQSIIGSAAIGAGWRLPLDLSAVYDIEGESYDSYAASSSTRRRITRIKPLKDVTVKEAAYYCRINRLSTVNWRRWDSFVAKGKREKAGVRSLERLTEDFITGLLATHPATVSTISRTGSKLVFKGGEEELGRRCPYCGMPAEKSSTSLVAEEALSADEAGLAGMMCYACRTTFAPVLDTTSSSSESTMGIPLPTWVQPRMLRRKGEAGQGDQGAMTMESMKKVVDEYLIPDNA